MEGEAAVLPGRGAACPPRVFVDHPVWPRVTCSRNALEVGCGERGLVEGGLVEGA